ncbi:hypothetical protein FGO68_gene5899 [Halteria grandinella]|uniref:Uncharacterized protein n=1 Tax=Halteria grandinella TaxID=5974 RepID=A0A8J8ND88_HALGN|nr:hypothetical protein FGO68_gene5899 [Halteria grandinella]
MRSQQKPSQYERVNADAAATFSFLHWPSSLLQVCQKRGIESQLTLSTMMMKFCSLSSNEKALLCSLTLRLLGTDKIGVNCCENSIHWTSLNQKQSFSTEGPGMASVLKNSTENAIIRELHQRSFKPPQTTLQEVTQTQTGTQVDIINSILMLGCFHQLMTNHSQLKMALWQLDAIKAQDHSLASLIQLWLITRGLFA